MKDLKKIYIDLSTCTEEQIKEIEKRTTKKCYYIKRAPFLHLFGKHWNQCMSESHSIKHKQELTYPEFIKLFEGGDYPGKQYQPLFDHLNQEHGLILHASEMDEIIRIVGGINSNQ